MYVTNYRILWVSNQTPFMNISLPYVQMKHVLSRYSQHGTAMVVESHATAGGYCLAFRIQSVTSETPKPRETGTRETPLSSHQQLGALISAVNKCFHEMRARPYFGPVDEERKTEQENFVIVVAAGSAQPAVPPAVPAAPSATADSRPGPLSPPPLGASRGLDRPVSVPPSPSVGAPAAEGGPAGRANLLEEIRGETPGHVEGREQDLGVRTSPERGEKIGVEGDDNEADHPREGRRRRVCPPDTDLASNPRATGTEEGDRPRILSAAEHEAHVSPPARPDEPGFESQHAEPLVGEGPGMPELPPVVVFSVPAGPFPEARSDFPVLLPFHSVRFALASAPASSVDRACWLFFRTQVSGGSAAPPGGPSRPGRGIGRFPFPPFSSPSHAPPASSQARSGLSPPSSSLPASVPEQADTRGLASSSPARHCHPGLSPPARGGALHPVLPAASSPRLREGPFGGPEEETAGPEAPTAGDRRGGATDGAPAAEAAPSSGVAVPLDLTKENQRADPLAPSARTLALLSPSSAKYITAPKCVICLTSPDEVGTASAPAPGVSCHSIFLVSDSDFPCSEAPRVLTVPVRFCPKWSLRANQTVRD
ncbi:hypothetical protein NCLIV_026940 [Neospora caninum Liverpool]|uniref:Bardet-Biedl syndrome 5, putative n=1 Tax=Neospora caninum (strain Liverpool) TaxID=572307 RepID=F0VGR2_NEOCL|nr:hypothetical protein NCLIV_026940 [Neospora caninum Liverpool]CBZ52906.1 hypothetical protein NCLIV_026940 [Neospora caninum Liverpool]CEL66888.1 TPA: Bardet-Biedl syndrome 5, putative [Neospora caninum Liverpool]|eukprot:XP_003882938.1 hypothetical protein NCLIV_026940 [Neospora caninum Liverpool]